MDPIKIIDLLLEKSIYLSLEKNNLHLSGNYESLSKEEIQLIKENKKSLIYWLRKYKSEDQHSDSIKKAHNKNGTFPAFSSQKHIFFIDKFGKGSPHYNMPMAFDVGEKIDENFVKKAFNKLIRRHKSLRTVFYEDETLEVMQAVKDDIEVPLNIIKLPETISKSEAEKEIEKNIAEEVGYIFNLRSGPLIRISLIKNKNSILIVNVHHIVCDGWSLRVLMSEFSIIYNSYTKNTEMILPFLPVEYTDYVKWKENNISKKELSKQEHYWISHLKGIPSLHNIPIKNKRKIDMDHMGSEFSVRLNGEQIKKIKNFSKKNKITNFMFLHGILSILLYKFSNEKDIVIGTPVSDRAREEVKNLVGLLIDNRVLRVVIDANDTISSYLNKIKEVNLSAITNNIITFETLLKLISPERSALYNPVFQILFSFDISENYQSDSSALPWGIRAIKKVMSKYELEIRGIEKENEWVIYFKYNSYLFSEDLIKRMGYGLQLLLNQAIEDDTKKIKELNVISNEERDNLIRVLNNTDKKFSSNKTIDSLFRASAKLYTDKVAVKFNGDYLTYGQLDILSSKLANYIKEKGVKENSFIGLLFDRSLELVVSILGIIKSGSAYVPLDPSLPTQRLGYIVNDCNLSCIISGAKTSLKLNNNKLVLIDFNNKLKSDLEKMNKFDPIMSASFSSLSLAYVIYTSGTTGNPKGVKISHKALINRIEWMQNTYKLTTEDKVLQKTPYGFDVSVWEFIWPIMYGAELVLAQPGYHKDPIKLAKVIKNENISIIHFVPSMFNAMLESNEWEKCKSVRDVFLSGEVLSPKLIKKHNLLNQARVHNLYGPTEAAIDVTYWDNERDIEINLVPIGKPIDNMKIFILDEDRYLVPKGTIGELYIGGVGLSDGYVNQKELTENYFIKSPFSKNEKLYRTGDLARYVSNDNVEYIGRCDDQLKIRGFRIEIGDIESNLKKIQGVKQVVVIAREENENKKYLIGFISVSESFKSEDAVLYELSTLIPEYMIPSKIIILNDFPMLSNGKIDRKSLHGYHVDIEEKIIPPKNKKEEIFCALWANNLKVAPQKIGVHSNYFSLGGDSISILKLVSEINKYFYVELLSLFENPTPAKLSSFIEANLIEENHETYEVSKFSLLTKEQERKIDKTKFEDAYPLTKLQEGMLYLNTADKNNLIYKDQIVIKTGLLWKPNIFRTVIQNQIDEQEVLRTVIQAIEGENIQAVLKEYEFEFLEKNISQADFSIDKNKLNEALREERQREFSIGKPLWRIKVFKLKNSEIIISFTCHHAILDGWSIATFITKVAINYQNLLKNRPIQKKITSKPKFSSYVAKELKAISDNESKSYWANAVKEYSIPWWTGNYVCETKVLQLSLYDIELDIRRFSEAEKTSVNNILLLAHLKVIAMLNGGSSIISSVVSHGRLAVENAENTLGLFLNTTPIGISFKDKTWRELLIDIERKRLEIKKYQHFPLAEVQSLTGQDYSGALFNYLDFHVFDEISEKNSMWELQHAADTNYSFTSNFRHNKSSGNLVYETRVATTLFQENHVQHIQQLMKSILRDIIENTDKIPNSNYLLSCTDKYDFLAKIGYKKTEHKISTCVHHKFEKWVIKKPKDIALSVDGNDYSYQQVNKLANQVSAYLVSLGIDKEELVCICMNRSFDLIVTLLGILKCGASYLPIESDYPKHFLNLIFEDSNAKCIITHNDTFDKFNAIKNINVINIDDINVKRCIDKQIESYDNTTKQLIHSLAYVNYTSGTTGRPKGVLVEHKGISRLVEMEQLKFSNKKQKFLFASSIAFDAATLEIWGALANGHCLSIYTDTIFDINTFNKKIVEDGITCLWLTSALFSQWSNNLPSELEIRLERIFVGGDVVNPHDVLRVYEKYSSVDIINGYGPTENTTFTCCYQIPRILDCSKSIPIGSDINGTVSYILDSEMELVPFGGCGELCVAGDGVARGYINLSEENMLKFVKRTLIGENGTIYKTGDIVRYDSEGKVIFMGRRDEQIKLRGYRIEIVEIESVISQLDEIKDTKVLLVDKEEKEKRLIAFVVKNDKILFENDDFLTSLKKRLQDLLPEFMVPSKIIAVDSIPITKNGKVDKNSLEKLYLEPIISHPNKMEKNTLKEEVCQIWSSALDFESLDVDKNYDFFELGGHSLLANKVVLDVNRRFSLNVKALDLFENSTLDEFSSYIKCQYNIYYKRIENYVLNLAQEILKVNENEINLDSDFFGLGGHSLLANQFSLEISKKYNIDLHTVLIFEYPIFQDLVIYIRSKFQDAYSEIEITLSKYWLDMLDLDENEISDNMDFFGMGGHSLLANRMANDISLQYEVSFLALDIFEVPKFIDQVNLIYERVSKKSKERIREEKFVEIKV